MLTFRKKRELKLYQRRVLIDSIQIGLASPDQIRAWAERKLPNGKRVGRVANSKTVDYKTLKPVKDGLFCERIFGPVRDNLCACGKRPASKKAKFCPDCGVEWTKSKARRYRLGYIELRSPVTHVWYTRGQPNYVAALLGKRRQSIEGITYCTRFVLSGWHNPAPPWRVPRMGMDNDPISNPPIDGLAVQGTAPAVAPSEHGRGTALAVQGAALAVQGAAQLDPMGGNPALGQGGYQAPLEASETASFKEGELGHPSPPMGRLEVCNNGRGEEGLATAGLIPGQPSELGAGVDGPALATPMPANTSARASAHMSSVNGSVAVSLVGRSYEWSHVVPVHPAFSREPDERQLLLDFVESSMEPEDVAIPLYSRPGGGLCPPSTTPLASLDLKDASTVKAIREANPLASSPTGPVNPTRPSEQTDHFQGTMGTAPGMGNPQLTLRGNSQSQLRAGRVLSASKGGGDRATSGEGLEIAPLEHVARAYEIRDKLRYTGGEALGILLQRLDMDALARFISQEMGELGPKTLKLVQLPLLSRSQLTLRNRLLRRRAKQGRRLKLARLFSQSGKRPEWMVLSILPVLPPELRPIVRLDGGVVVVSDLNKLYQKVLFRNSRLEELRMVDLNSVGQAKRLLQEAVDGLLDNGKGGSLPISGPNDRPLKSLSDGLKGKKGRFRQNLLGKRVDYSGRSVIVVGPSLKLHQCGLPKEMAIELFQPFLSRLLMDLGLAENITAAKRLMSQDHPSLWDVLQLLLQRHPVLLNRAPTLHRLGIQAFQPKLVHGRAILLHPLVCTAFNADFDGDQMAVHIPLSPQAQGEAWKLLWSRNNLLSPATGQPILAPSQDMVLGCYYLTTTNPQATWDRGLLAGPVSSHRPMTQATNPQLALRVTPQLALRGNPQLALSGGPQLALRATPSPPLADTPSETQPHEPIDQSQVRGSAIKPLLAPLSMRVTPHKQWLPTAVAGPRRKHILWALTLLRDNSARHSSAEPDGREIGWTPPAMESHHGVATGLTPKPSIVDPRATLAHFRGSSQGGVDASVSSHRGIEPLVSPPVALCRGVRGSYFSTFNESIQSYHQALVGIHTLVWVRFNGLAERDLVSEEPLEIRLNCYGGSRGVSTSYQEIGDLTQGGSNRFVRTTIGRILVNSSLDLV